FSFSLAVGTDTYFQIIAAFFFSHQHLPHFFFNWLFDLSSIKPSPLLLFHCHLPPSPKGEFYYEIFLMPAFVLHGIACCVTHFNFLFLIFTFLVEACI